MALEKAKSFGDYLCVHVASDQEAKWVKGKYRPIITGKERAKMIASLKCVDEIIYHDHYLSYVDLLESVKPNILILNLEGNPEDVEEECSRRGITVVKIPRCIPQSGLDTTGIIEKICGEKIMDHPQIAGVNYFLIRPDRKILIQRRDNIPGIRCPGMIAVPGGMIEKGENPFEALMREIKEETGIVINPIRCDFLQDFTYEWGEIGRYFVCFIDISEDIVSSEGKMEWVSLDWLKEQSLAGKQENLIHKLEEYLANKIS